MSTTTQVTLEQYYEMLPNYEREPEFDDGEIVERPMPTKPHSEMLEFLIFAFRAFRPEFRSYPEWTIAPREGSRRIPWNWMAMCTPMRASSACRMASFGRESWK